MPIAIAPTNVELTIVKILVNDEKTKKHLESLGVIPTGKIRVISVSHGNAIIEVKGVRLGLNSDVAKKILVA